MRDIIPDSQLYVKAIFVIRIFIWNNTGVMKRRVFMVHGWEGYPEEGWRPWLREELESRGFEVHIPAMPDTHHPKQAAWVSHLQKITGKLDEHTYLIGHSLGCIGILRFLESLPKNTKVGGVILVAGFDDDLGVSALSDFFIAEINWEKIRSHTENFISIESDNDPYNLAKYNSVFKEKLHAKTILMHNMKHFSGDDGITKLPIVLDELLQLIQ
jgi:predicted alpha/beta hydrolase family esterase